MFCMARRCTPYVVYGKKVFSLCCVWQEGLPSMLCMAINEFEMPKIALAKAFRPGKYMEK